ncbi:LysR family transcriptional regulator [Sneathiella litorea]|uniref:LysR family transcriptional regulator n=1 Tax=Sneathiella litorea TaxID=2606216 RepID=A0A6L8W5Q5_9PROT|nr:LysR family transcriptional regulator [Sneathiella litorea]MZR30411.1 LysR family transcriptional regulator [Sneathiella litorea]
MRVLSLQRLEIFRTIYETNNISEAARRLKLTQPTVSRHLRDFEASLQIQLFMNESGRIKPTWEAHRLFEECRGSFERLQQIENAISSIREGRGETLSLMSAPSFFASNLLPPAIRDILKAYPAIDVSVDVGNSATQLQALREGTIDIGLVSGLRNIPDIDIHVVGIDRIMVVVSEDHPMANAEVFPLEALEEYSCIMPSPRAPIGGQIARRFEELGVKTNKLMTAVSPAITPGLVQELNCCAILDHLTAAAFSHLSIKIVPLSIDLQFEVQVIESTGSPKRAVTDVYIQSLRQILKDITHSSLDFSQT